MYLSIAMLLHAGNCRSERIFAPWQGQSRLELWPVDENQEAPTLVFSLNPVNKRNPSGASCAVYISDCKRHAARLQLLRRAHVLPKPDHVSVVIPTKNAGSRFGDVLKALKAQEFHGVIDITIVDSGSDDRTTELAEKYGARVIRINPDTFDHGLTRNLAIEHVPGDLVVLLTQHAVPGTCRMISELVKALEDSAVAGVYGRRIPHFDTGVLTRREIQEAIAGRIEPGAVSAKSYEALTPTEKYALCNFDHSCAAIRKSVWQEFPFRQNTFAEDLEWGRRVVAAGWKVSYEPAAFVTDFRHRSFVDQYKRTYLYYGKLYSLFGLSTFRTFFDALSSVPRRASRNFSSCMANGACASPPPHSAQ